jgi:hypothetical protein
VPGTFAGIAGTRIDTDSIVSNAQTKKRIAIRNFRFYLLRARVAECVN